MDTSVDTPYNLYWTDRQYKEIGAKLGFEFTNEELREARSSNRVLGTKRYLPKDDAPVRLGLPPGVLVKCQLRPLIGVDSPSLDEEAIQDSIASLTSLVEKASSVHPKLSLLQPVTDKPTFISAYERRQRGIFSVNEASEG